MAVSIVTYTGDGSTTQYVITFEYISRDDVVVQVNDVDAAFTFINDTTVELSSTPTSGDRITIKRETPTAPLVDFADGSTLFESDLDLSGQQSRYLAEEARDRADEAISVINNNINDVNTVADISGDVTNVASQISPTNNVATLAGISANITTLAGLTSEITTVSSINTDVSTVSSDSADIQNLAGISADLQTLADLEDGTTATNALSDLAAISADITSVAADQADIGVVSANIASVNTVASNIDHVIDVANDLNEAISEIETVANDLNEATSEIDVVANNIASVNIVGTNISAINNVSSISSDVSAVNAISSDIASVGTISSAVSNVSSISTQIQSLNTISSDITSVSGISADVSTVASNLNSISDFAEKYRIGSSDPSTSLDTGDLFYNTTSNTLKIYNGSAWEAGVTAGSGFLAQASNLSDLNNAATARQNLGVEIGVDVQAYNANLAAINQNLATNNSPSFVSASFTGTTAIELPSGTASQRPSSPTNGMLRYNTEDNAFEGYVDNAWGEIGGGGAAAEILDCGTASSQSGTLYDLGGASSA